MEHSSLVLYLQGQGQTPQGGARTHTYKSIYSVLSCLSLALKMHSSKAYPVRELAALSSRAVTCADIVQKEGHILELVDFNLVIPHRLDQLFTDDSLTEDQIQRGMLMGELLMVKDCSVFLNPQKVRAILGLLKCKSLKKSEAVEEDWKPIWS